MNENASMACHANNNTNIYYIPCRCLFKWPTINNCRDLIGKTLREKVKAVGFKDVDSFLLSLADEKAIKLNYSADGGYLFRAGVS